MLALVALSLFDVYFTAAVYLEVAERFQNTTAIPFDDFPIQYNMQPNFILSSFRNGIDTFVCWIFLVIVTRSPRFVGCSTIIKNLIRLAKF